MLKVNDKSLMLFYLLFSLFLLMLFANFYFIRSSFLLQNEIFDLRSGEFYELKVRKSALPAWIKKSFKDLCIKDEELLALLSDLERKSTDDLSVSVLGTNLLSDSQNIYKTEVSLSARGNRQKLLDFIKYLENLKYPSYIQDVSINAKVDELEAQIKLVILSIKST